MTTTNAPERPRMVRDGRFVNWRRGDVWAAGADDLTPTHMTYPTGYNAQCSWCWLGYGHTDREHERRVADQHA